MFRGEAHFALYKTTDNWIIWGEKFETKHLWKFTAAEEE